MDTQIVVLILVMGIVTLLLSISIATSRRKATPIARPPQENNEDAQNWRSWIKHPAFFIAAVVIIFDLIVWMMIPWLWKVLAHNWGTLIIFSVGSWFALYLVIAAKFPQSSMVAKALGLTLIVGLVSIWFQNPKLPIFGNLDKYSESFTQNAPEEIILREIAMCESGGQQFRDNVVVRNTNGTGDPSDDDIGILQINLKHQAKLIEELKADVYTEEGNWLVGREILRRQGTGPWSKSRHCWGPKLVALGYNPDGKGPGVPSPRIEEVATEPGEWSQPVKNDRRFGKVRWYPNITEGCEIRADEDDNKVFGCDQVLDLNAVPKTFSFRHKGKKPMTVEVRFTDPFTR